ncbi:hypothetical protein HH308_13540 [Gordonia sp. TBRC 11910]|uniref:Uncharacterized protein n=1 Tax=Gordonia asplenii TaxID=2725283 RepID=A0A848KU66_9ACTN|nr:hypothetical protein [Gordonia asplenii]NMO02236.1 hypothetical protein [Gordonia asplenii]
MSKPRKPTTRTLETPCNSCELAPAIEAGDFTTDQATLSVFLRVGKIWRDEMITAGQRANLRTANLHNLEIADAAGHRPCSILAQFQSNRAAAAR